MTTPIYQPSDKKILINGTDVTQYLVRFWVEIPSCGSRTAGISFLYYIYDAFTINNGDIIELYKGEPGETLVRVFYGIITGKTEDTSGIFVSAIDELWKASGQTLVKLYDTSDPEDLFGGDIRLIFLDLCKEAGLDAEDSTIDQTSVIIPQMLCDNVKIIQKMQEIADLLYFDYFQDPVDRKIYLKNPENYTVYANTLEVGGNVTENPQYKENISQVVNEVEIQGVIATPVNVETFTGTGTQTSYALLKYPIATYIKVTVDGTLLVGSVEGSLGSYDYLANINKGTVTFTTAPTAGAVIEIEYTSFEQTNVTVDSPESKAATNRTSKLVFSMKDVITVDDATQRASKLIETSKDPFVNFTVDVVGESIATTNKVNYSDTRLNKSFSEMNITKIKITWPEITDEVSLGKNKLIAEKIIFTVEERVKRLERRSTIGINLTVNKFLDNKFYFIIDDFEIIREDVATSAQEIIVKRRHRFNEFNELVTGTYDGNITIDNGKIEFI